MVNRALLRNLTVLKESRTCFTACSHIRLLGILALTSLAILNWIGLKTGSRAQEITSLVKASRSDRRRHGRIYNVRQAGSCLIPSPQLVRPSAQHLFRTNPRLADSRHSSAALLLVMTLIRTKDAVLGHG